MRLFLWAPAFAIAVGALLGRRDAPSAPASSPASSSVPSTASSSTATPSPTSVNTGDYKYVCQIGGPSQKAWNDLDMGFFLNTTSNMWCKNKDKCPKGPYEVSFTKSLALLLPDHTDFDCEIGNDDCGIPQNEDWCNNELWARTSFALKAVKNFHDYINLVLKTIEEARSEFGVHQMSYITKFTTHDISQDDSASKASMGLTLGAGIMAIISGILGPLGAIFDGTAGTALTVAAGVTGSLSGGSTVGIGVANHLSENVAEVLQKELISAGNMSDIFGSAFDHAEDSVRDFGGHAINDVPTNYDIGLGYTYKDDPSGAPAILNNGVFADHIDYKDHDQLLHETRTIGNMAAIGYIWRTYEKIYIAKLTQPFRGVDPCDIPIKDLHRECKDSKAYFFVKWEDKAADHHWTKPPGIDDIDALDYVDLFAMAEAAEYNQKQYGYDHKWDPKDAAAALASDNKPPHGMMVNLPVCYMDGGLNLYDSTKGPMEPDIKQFLNWECRTIPKYVKYWPYDFIGHDPGEVNPNFDPDDDDAADGKNNIAHHS